MRGGERVPGEGEEKEKDAAERKVGGGKSENRRSGRKLQEGPPWVGFLLKVLPPEKAILVSRSVRLAASLSRLPKMATLASDERLERAVSGDMQKGGRESRSKGSEEAGGSAGR